MSSIEQLAKEKGGVIEALSLIGLSTAWIGAFTAHPTLFKQHLREHKRNSARVIHPDQGQTDLSNQAGVIYSAFDLLNETDDDTLAKAMRQFVDEFSIPRVKVLDVISLLKAEKDALQQQRDAEISKNYMLRQELEKPDDHGVSVLINTLQSAFNQPEDYDENGKIIRTTDLAEGWFYTPTWISSAEGDPDEDDVQDNPDEINAALYIVYVARDGSCYKEEVSKQFPKKMSEKEVKEQLLASARKKITEYRASIASGSFKTQGGTVLGFVTSNLDLGFDSEDHFFPSYKFGEFPEHVISAKSQDFVEGTKKELKQFVVYHADTPKQLEQLGDMEPVEHSYIPGVVVLDVNNTKEATVKCLVYYVEGFIK